VRRAASRVAGALLLAGLHACSDDRAAIAAALDGGELELQQRALWTVAARGPDAAWAVPRVTAALADARIAAVAAWALAEIGPAAAEARDELLRATRDASFAVRAGAAWALGRLELRDAEVRAALVALGADADALTRRAAAAALRHLDGSR
jgi:hypothetical protein